MLGRRRRSRRDDETVDVGDRLADAAPEARTWTEEELADLRAGVERRRSTRARLEAQQELERLRARHWSGERVVEEGALGVEFWQHHQADPYAVLGLLPGATLREVTARRRELARELHPDVDPEHAERMAAVNAAFERIRQALRQLPPE